MRNVLVALLPFCFLSGCISVQKCESQKMHAQLEVSRAAQAEQDDLNAEWFLKICAVVDYADKHGMTYDKTATGDQIKTETEKILKVCRSLKNSLLHDGSDNGR